MTWSIEGDGEALNPAGYDGSVWQWRLRHDNEPQREHVLILRISGSAMAMGEEALPTRVALARETEGRSEVEVILDWPELPADIDIDSSGVRIAGGNPGPEQREINEIIEWFDERGAIVVFAARGGGTGPIENVQWTKHSAHVMARDVDQYLFHAEGSSRLEAVRRAKERWETEGHGVLLGKLETGGTSDAKLTLTIDREAVKALRSEGYRVVWTEPTDPDDPIWMGQAFDDDGVLLEMALGKDPQDVLLELAEALLPKDGTPE